KATKSAQVGGGPSPDMFCEDGCYLRDAAVAGFAAAGGLAGSFGSPVGEVVGAALGGALGGLFYDASANVGDGCEVAGEYQAAADVKAPSTRLARDPRALN